MSKKTEGEMKQLQDEELGNVEGGLFGITIYDRCEKENPERKFMPALCKSCPNFEIHADALNYLTEVYCHKVQRIIYSKPKSGL